MELISDFHFRPLELPMEHEPSHLKFELAVLTWSFTELTLLALNNTWSEDTLRFSEFQEQTWLPLSPMGKCHLSVKSKPILVSPLRPSSARRPYCLKSATKADE